MLTEKNPPLHPELWGGIECTINRVGDDFYDQLAFAELYKDPHIDAIASLGIKKLRFPLLWERHQPDEDTEIDWSWSRTQLEKLRAHGIDPIVGFVHHGSGPECTSLLDDAFPEKLAAYAAAVATEFPFLKYFTPVNEPLTTARFSALYGYWYPHHRDDASFAKALLLQLKGIVLSMKAIRRIIPDAQLVQTEDLGKTYSTPKLQYQAKFENERRWLTYDILCGKLVPGHPLWRYFTVTCKTPVKDLQFFSKDPCVPDLFGFNYYVTSERFLDHEHTRYPRNFRGGNKKHRYADVEAFRVPLQVPHGAKHVFREAWERYRHPMVITEVHLHSHREEQIRWFKYIYHNVSQLQFEGADIRAITAWSLFGAYGWDKLLTKPRGTYEPGVFDMRGGKLRETALAKYIRSLTGTTGFEHPHFAGIKGWWERDIRLLFHPREEQPPYWEDEQPLLIIGKRGTLGKAFARICAHRALPYRITGRDECDLSDESSIERMLDTVRPWAVVNAAGFVRVDDAEIETEACHRDNCTGPVLLARLCAAKGIRLATYSSDLVFDGTKGKPYVESDPVAPLNEYGRSKARCEKEVLAVNPHALVVRTSAFFGPWDNYNFLHWAEQQLSAGMPVIAADDEIVSPTYIPDLVHATLDLLIDGEAGIRHLANKGAQSWADLARMVARRKGYDEALVEGTSSAAMERTAQRPLYSVLGTEKGNLMPRLSNAVDRYFAEKHSIAQLAEG